MERRPVDFEQTQPLGLNPRVDVLVDPRPAPPPPPRRQAWRPVGTGLELLRDLLAYRLG